MKTWTPRFKNSGAPSSIMKLGLTPDLGFWSEGRGCLRFMGIEVLTRNPIDDILSSVRIITTKRLEQYCRKHALAKPSLSRWVRITKKARWTTWEDVKSSFSSADLVKVASGRNCVVFNIAGNEYRLIAAVHHARGEGKGRVYILNFLTHAEYDTNQWKEHL